MWSILAVMLGAVFAIPRLSNGNIGGGSSDRFLSLLPDQEYSQIVRVSPDEQITAYVSDQLGNDPAIIQTLDRVDDFLLAQRWEADLEQNIMIAQWDDLQTDLFASLWLLEPTDGYQFAQVNGDTVAYWPSDLVQDMGDSYTTRSSQSLEHQLIDHKNNASSSIWFMSRPSRNIAAGLGLPLSQKIQWTIASVDLWPDLLPNGDIYMYFDKGIISEKESSRSSLVSDTPAAGSLSLSHILSMIGVDSAWVSLFLPFVLEQYLGESIAMLSKSDYEAIYTALDGAILVEMKETEIGSAYILTLWDPEIFGIFEKLAPFVQAQLGAQVGSGSIVTDFWVNQLDRNVNIAEKWAFPYLSIYQWTQSTSIWLFTDEFGIYSASDSKNASDILGTFEISPALLPLTDASTWLPIWGRDAEPVLGKIVLDSKEGALRVEMR